MQRLILLGALVLLATAVLKVPQTIFGQEPTPTAVSGSMTGNTTWTAAKSPYVIADTVTVFPDVTLTIEPGVEVRATVGKGLTIRGALVAEGTTDRRITFTSANAQSKGGWDGIRIANNEGGKASLKFVTIQYALNALALDCCHKGGPVTIADSIIRENTNGLVGYAGDVKVEVDRTTFENNGAAVTSADKVIRNSTFRNNTYGLSQTERVSVYNSTFTNNEVAVWGGRGELKQSTITSNGIGVKANYEGLKLTYNTITGNGSGVTLGEYDHATPDVMYNNIFGNTSFNVKNSGVANKEAKLNWWGTTDTAAINASIIDGTDDQTTGVVTYLPVASQAVDIVAATPPPAATLPAPTPTPEQTGSTPAAGPTNVSGSIFENTTWTAAKSPYIVTDTVVVFPGATLSIEPGVEVRVANVSSLSPSIQIRGALVAEGTTDKRIVFTSNLAQPTRGSWNGIRISTNLGAKASVRFATIQYAATGFYFECCNNGGPVTISDALFKENGVALAGYAGSVVVDVNRTTFENNGSAVTSADKVIRNSTFRNNTYGLGQTERTSVYNSTFTGHKIAVWGGRGTLSQSTITGNEVGVQANYEGLTLERNTVTNNDVGVILGQYDGSTPPVTNNNIYGNTTYNLKTTGPSNKEAKLNWWGTTDTAAIEKSIYDGRDDSSLGIVTYQPIATQLIDTSQPTLVPPSVLPPPVSPAPPTPPWVSFTGAACLIEADYTQAGIFTVSWKKQTPLVNRVEVTVAPDYNIRFIRLNTEADAVGFDGPLGFVASNGQLLVFRPGKTYRAQIFSSTGASDTVPFSIGSCTGGQVPPALSPAAAGPVGPGSVVVPPPAPGASASAGSGGGGGGGGGTGAVAAPPPALTPPPAPQKLETPSSPPPGEPSASKPTEENFLQSLSARISQLEGVIRSAMEELKVLRPQLTKLRIQKVLETKKKKTSPLKEKTPASPASPVRSRQ